MGRVRFEVSPGVMRDALYLPDTAKVVDVYLVDARYGPAPTILVVVETPDVEGDHYDARPEWHTEVNGPVTSVPEFVTWGVT